MRTLISLALLVALPALAGEASGEFKTSKRVPIRPKYAAAYESRDQRDARKRVIEVVLSEEPVDAKAAALELDPHSNVINQSALMEHNYVLLWVRPGNDVSINATYRENMTQFVDMTPGRLQAKIDVLTPRRSVTALERTTDHEQIHQTEARSGSRFGLRGTAIYPNGVL